ncbi:MAG: 2-dehydropantoate 2-reductase [Lachnospiraceae bacterium]|nr:2-dehydropantoate 2-reductase [Lachnospiraceae bacterium]
MEIRQAAIVGAGAVGAYFIRGMQPAMGERFMVLAEGNRAQRLNENGLVINGETVPLNVQDFACAPQVDLLIISTKYTALQDVFEKVKPLVGQDTVVLTVLNGIDSEELAGAALGAEHIVYSYMVIVSARKGDSIVIDPACPARINFGELSGEETERTAALCRLFDECGIDYHLSDRIVNDQWNKFAINISNNLLQAVLGVGYGAYFDSAHIAHLHRKIMDEVLQAAAAEGMEITSIPTPQNIAAPGARFSTLQDIDAGRPTETDMFLGVLLKIAERHGLQLPYCDYTYHALKALEEKNAGRFDY